MKGSERFKICSIVMLLNDKYSATKVVQRRTSSDVIMNGK